MADALGTPGGVVSDEDLRLDLAGLIAAQSSSVAVRTGVMFGPGTTSIVTGTSATGTMTVNVGVCHWVSTRASADGVYLGTKEASTTLNIAAAPGSNSRIDVVYAKQNDAGSTISADGTTGETYGVVTGTAAASPVKPSLPVGAVEIGTVTVAAGVTSTAGAGVTINNTAPLTVARGARIPVRTQTERDALTAFKGLEVYRLDTGQVQLCTSTGPTVWKNTYDPTINRKPRKFVDTATGTTYNPPGPLTVHGSRTIDPAALFGPGFGAQVIIDAHVLLDTTPVVANTRWDLNIAKPALSGTAIAGTSQQWTGRGSLRAVHTDEILAGATGSYSTFLTNGSGSGVVSYSDAGSNRCVYTVIPVEP